MRSRKSDLVSHLCAIEAALSQDNPKAGAKVLTETGRQLLSAAAAQISRELRTRLTGVYEKLMASGMKGRAPAEKGILTCLVAGADESLVSFFAGLFDVSIERDGFSLQRKAFATAGLAVLVRSTGSQAALDALLKGTAHTNGDVALVSVRALAAAYSVSVFYDFESEEVRSSLRSAPPLEVIEAVTQTANQHPTFLTRFHARRALQALGVEPPLDHEEGAYQFKMTLEGYTGFSARLLVPSPADLDMVLWLSLDALNWDSDHLHSFYLSGKRNDQSTQYPLDRGDSLAEEPGLSVGELGLAPKVKFICLYDFGDCNIFKYTCEKIIPKVHGNVQGSVQERKGRRPNQYPSW